jgi:hypothetical protein
MNIQGAVIVETIAKLPGAESKAQCASIKITQRIPAFINGCALMT